MTAPTDGRRRYVERARAGMRESILDAVGTLIRDRGWAETRMADVAGAAGVSRQTVYQLYGSREELAQQFVLHETDRYLRNVEDAVRARPDDPHAALIAGLEAFLFGANDNALILAVRSGDGTDGLLPLVTSQSRPLIDAATERLAAVILDVWPALGPDAGDVRVVAETVVRLAISHVMVAGADPRRASDEIVRVLAPFFRHLFERRR